ncbi:COG0535 Predicted Fe-S oxidoreductases [uncultured Caudovirales phage]|uniref:COG0535 Predicted Fe-S oxidoreductases n=1 Tax=uncultured Caudovirales phage TaxID=2100421 RepID=A0A6J7WKX0_9CAUD|nr:COG0535 Predicted Fe-S oxidoreductases [uncultured Caudovirales phage]CAB5208782.1 COG0535 Predicted Fe-S oxidoreductases [uncultured Caudovirales phage]
MFNFSQLKQIHLEITNNCQASCPMCSRNIHGGLENPLMKINSWTLDDFKNIMTNEVLDQLESYYFCGNFGDPILNNDLIKMCAYSKDIAPNTRMAIHTNGGARNTDWWQSLAQALPVNHRVVFALDGLKGTHELYRIGTDFDKVIENAKAFISAGGKAEWAFIRFKHNEHQVEEAKQMAVKLGFEQFTTKDSSRFLLDPKYPVYDKQGNTTHNLEPSGYSEIKFIDRNVIKNYKAILQTTDIKCQSEELKEIYIDAFGRVFPCCYIAMIPYIPLDTESSITPIRLAILEEYRSLVSDLGGIDALDARNHSIKDIVNSTPYQTVWQQYWDEKKLITCARSCGVTAQFSKPKDQFIQHEKFEQ